MSTLRKPLFFFLVLVVLGAGGCPQTSELFEEQLRLAQRGDLRAQVLVASMYLDGHGPTGEEAPQDDQEAVKWVRKAADLGHVESQYLVGRGYFKGIGVPQDYKEAVKWYRKAAEQGNADAQYSLGVMYQRGDGVPRDLLPAYMWLNLALSNSTSESLREEYIKDLYKLEKYLIRVNPELIFEAQRLSREWKPKGKNE